MRKREGLSYLFRVFTVGNWWKVLKGGCELGFSFNFSVIYKNYIIVYITIRLLWILIFLWCGIFLVFIFVFWLNFKLGNYFLFS